MEEIKIPECKMESRQDILQQERTAMNVCSSNRVDYKGDPLITQLLLDIRDLLVELNSQNKPITN